MTNILNRYASAVRSSNLRSQEATIQSDTDVLGAVGLAAKRNPLAMALARLFCGDNRSARELVEILSGMAWTKSKALNIKLKRVQADSMAQAVLAWHRDGVCRACGGHGFQLIQGAPSIGDQACPACRGTGRVPFETHFSVERRPVACWLLAEVEREQAKAGPAAMSKLADSLRL